MRPHNTYPLIFLTLFFFSCNEWWNLEKYDFVEIQTEEAVNIEFSSAVLNGIIQNPREEPLLEHGFVWSEKSVFNEEINELTREEYRVLPLGEVEQSGKYFSTLRNLQPKTTYYFRAYTERKDGKVIYGDVLSFNTTVLPLELGIFDVIKSNNQELEITSIIEPEASLDFIKEYGHIWSFEVLKPRLGTVEERNKRTRISGSSRGVFKDVIIIDNEEGNIFLRPYVVLKESEEEIYGEVWESNVSLDFQLNTFSHLNLCTEDSLIVEGQITDLHKPITAYGHCWSFTNSQPTLDDNDGFNGYGTVESSTSFSSTISNINGQLSVFIQSFALDGQDLIYGNVIALSLQENCRNTWNQRRSILNGGVSSAKGISLNGKGYICTGWNGVFRNNLWEYDPSLDVWTEKEDFAGVARTEAVGFGIGEKIYIGTGFTGSQIMSDFWEYDVSTESWTQKTDVGGGPRRLAVGFAIGGLGYVGTGHDGNTGRPDFWEYDPQMNIWHQKKDFGGWQTWKAVGFSIVGKGYIGTGIKDEQGSAIVTDDFWQYDPSSDVWTQKANFGGGPRANAVSFVIRDKAYVGTGQDAIQHRNDFWEYDPFTNSWTQVANFGGVPRSYAIGFSIDGKGYIGAGLLDQDQVAADFWEYTPE